MNFLQTFYLTHFSRPVSHRTLFRHIQADHPRKILEIGIQRGERTVSLMQMVLRFCGEKSDVHYCGIDSFESRTKDEGAGLSLRKAHHIISQFEIKSRLIPSAPVTAIKQLHINRQIEQVDLLILAMPNYVWLEHCHVSLNELLHETATIFIGILSTQADEPYRFEKISTSDIEYMAKHRGELPQWSKKLKAA